MLQVGGETYHISSQPICQNYSHHLLLKHHSSQTYSIIFVCFVVKLWKKALEQKYLFFFWCFHQISLLLSNSWQGWVSFNWVSIFLIYFRQNAFGQETSDLSFHLLFSNFSEWANVIGLCFPFLYEWNVLFCLYGNPLEVLPVFLVEGTDALCLNYCFLLEIWGIIIWLSKISESVLYISSKVKFLMEPQEEGKDTALIWWELKVRDGFRVSSPWIWKVQVVLLGWAWWLPALHIMGRSFCVWLGAQMKALGEWISTFIA